MNKIYFIERQKGKYMDENNRPYISKKKAFEIPITPTIHIKY